MPELPEVETIVKDLQAAKLVGKKIVKAHVFWMRSIATPEKEKFQNQIKDQEILQISRRGKYLVFRLSKQTLLVHLRMTGKFSLDEEKSELSSHERVNLQLDDGRVLHFEDQRKFGKWYLLNDPDKFFEKIGIEPLSKEFTLDHFQRLIEKHSVQAKPFLLNQAYVTGLGNIYVDEALWEAKIHPQRRVNTLSKQEIKALYQAIPKVLLQGIAQMGTSLGNKQANYYSLSGRRGDNQHKLKVFRRDGEPCPRCHELIIKTIVAQRGTHLCPHCQIK